jgi:asparagine synthase (glutamine-hydrolysing)
MCGILGAVGAPDQVREESLLEGLRGLAHRGPDDCGWHVLRQGGPQPISVFLGNRRLAILDLSAAGHQPMHDPKPGNWIVYNGELYNFKDIRSELQSAGVSFDSRSDTEVILKAYGCWGPQCLQRFRGMFAFAIWDAQQQQLFIARDRFGEKPLYYFLHDGVLFFASEVRALLRTGRVPRRLNPVGLFQFLMFGSVYDPSTLIEDVYALPPAHYMVFKDSSLEQTRYWDVDTTGSSYVVGGNTEKPRPQVTGELCEILREAVTLRTVSDVPIGLFLSGGIDSSALAAVLHRSQSAVSTFTITFKEHDYNEAGYSRAIAGLFHTDHHEILMSLREAMVAIPDAIRAMDQATVDGINTYVVSREATRHGLKVALSGVGGDEIFGGYSTFRSIPSMERFSWVAGVLSLGSRRLLAQMFRWILPRSDRNEKLSTLVEARLEHPYLVARMLFTPRQLDGLCQLWKSGSYESALHPFEDSFRSSQRFDPINRVSYLELRNYMANTLLRDIDSMSMAHGLEVRAPFVDHPLIEYLFTLSGCSKLSENPKHLLTAAVDSVLPRVITHRLKRGFTLPFEHWLRGELRREVERVLLRDSPASEYVNPASVKKIWKAFQAGHTSWSRPWSLYVLSKWAMEILQ